MGQRIPAEVFPPGEAIKEELGARGWSQVELADIMGRPAQVVRELVSGKRAITPETAKGLGAAFGTGATFWINMECSYQLSKTAHDDEAVSGEPGYTPKRQ
jgi:HTH-type transcriptional regulator/antitoxin HigA